MLLLFMFFFQLLVQNKHGREKWNNTREQFIQFAWKFYYVLYMCRSSTFRAHYSIL